MLDFSPRVAIVTGAGRGIGREIAIGLAKRGASVLVNDYGGDNDTQTPGSIDVAQAVVDEIQAAGGKAVADGNSVGTGASAQAIVDNALKAFGRVDILVNNAGGGLGQTRLDKDTDERNEGVIRSNLIGPFMLVRRLWPLMKAQRYGRIVHFMSGTMTGMVGTGPYSMGKSGLIGLMNTILVEGREHGILTNGVWPVAFTRLAGQLEDPEIYARMQQFTPSLVAEGTIFLCSEENEASGEMFTIGGGMIARNALFTCEGYRHPELTAELVARNFEQARDMSQPVMLEPVHLDGIR